MNRRYNRYNTLQTTMAKLRLTSIAAAFAHEPAHPYVLHAHQSRCVLQVGAEGPGFQIEKHESHTETPRICLADKKV